MMARVTKTHNTNPTRVTLIWAICVFLFYIAFQMLLRNSQLNGSYPSSSSSSDASISGSDRRARLYDTMAKDLDEHGLAFLKHGKTSQSLSLSEMFTVRDGVLISTPKAANPPVRANVLYLSPEYSIPISKAVQNVFTRYFDKAIWFQNSSLYHFSLLHASHHISPVSATEDEINAEADAVRSVVQKLCPLKIVLDRVVLTSTGVLLGCWQVSSGVDPVSIRAKLRSALPRAPEKQLYNAAMLHTSFARLLGPPRIPDQDPDGSSAPIQFFHGLVTRLNNQLRGFEAVVSELWYVEELDVLALGLDGRMKIRRFQLGCSEEQASQH